MNLRIQRKKIPAALVILFLLMLTAKDFVGVSIPEIAFTVLWLLILLFADEDTSTAFTLASVICFASTLSITIPCVFYFVLSLIRKKAVKLDAILLVSIYVALIEFVRLMAGNGEDFRLYVNSMAILFLVYAVVVALYDRRARPETCIKYYLGFFSFLSVEIIWATANSLGGINLIIAGSFRIGQVNTLDESMMGIFSINANGLALMSIVAVSLTMLLYVKKQMSIRVAIPLLVYSSVVGLLTVSKTFMLVYVGYWMLYYLWYSRNSSKNLLKPLELVALFIVVITIVWNTDIVQNVLVRFDTNDITTGRMDITEDYLDFMRENSDVSIFGLGLQNISNKTGIIRVPHNAILEIFVCFGIVGVLGYIFFFITLLRKGRNFWMRKPNVSHLFINYIPFIVFLIFIQSLQFLRITYIYSTIALVFAAMIVDKKIENS